MEITYTVHSVGAEQEQVTVEYEGVEVPALITIYIVELVSDHPSQKNHLIRVSQAQMDANPDLFVQDAKVVSTFAPAE